MYKIKTSANSLKNLDEQNTDYADKGLNYQAVQKKIAAAENPIGAAPTNGPLYDQLTGQQSPNGYTSQMDAQGNAQGPLIGPNEISALKTGAKEGYKYFASGDGAATAGTQGAAQGANAGSSLLGQVPSSLSNLATAAAVAKGGYDAAKGYQNGGKGTRAGLTEIGAGLGSIGGPLGTGAGAIIGNTLGYGMQGNGWKNDAALAALGPLGWTVLAAKLAGVPMSHETTAQREQKRWGKLVDDKVAGADAAYGANHPTLGTGTWDTGKYAGQKWTFDKALDLAKEDPTHFQKEYGNYAVFGNDWEKYSDLQQKAIVSALVNAGLYAGHKGDVIITDADKAREVANLALSQMGQQQAQQSQGGLNIGSIQGQIAGAQKAQLASQKKASANANLMGIMNAATQDQTAVSNASNFAGNFDTAIKRLQRGGANGQSQGA